MSTLTSTLLISAGLSVPVLSSLGCEDDCCILTKFSKAVLASNSAESTILETAAAAGSFETLLAAVSAAGLEDVLEGEGPFTVLAPTDAAFAALPEGTLAELLKPENKGTLASILTYHVIPSKVTSDQVLKSKGAVTANGQRIDIHVKRTKDKTTVMIDNAEVVTTDIECGNGVIHVIDTVILPASKNLAETAVEAGSFRTLVAAAQAAGLVEALASDKSELTVFAPTDEAFAALPEGTVESLLKPENKETLVTILKHHIVPGRIYSEQVIKQGSVKTLAGTTLTLQVNDNGACMSGAKLLTLDLDATNGVVHVIDTVLIPPTSN